MSASLRTIAFGAAALLGAAAGQAQADDADQLTVPAGHGVVNATVGVNLSAGAAFEPVSLSPDLWYGVSEPLSVGVIHSSRGTTGFLGGVGQSLCLTGDAHGCGSLYPGGGIAARYGVARGTTAVAIDAGLFAGDVDPFTLSLKLGASARWRSGKVAVEASPALFVGVTERDAGNEEVFGLPITASYAVADRAALALQSGVILPFEGTGDAFLIPLSLAASYALDAHISLDAAFTLPALAGGDAAPTGTDLRTFSLGGAYAF